MVGAALVFFAYIGFDSISTHSEEAIKPQRDVPLGILVSLAMCTVLYILVAAVITGMEPYPEIDTGAAVAARFAGGPRSSRASAAGLGLADRGRGLGRHDQRAVGHVSQPGPDFPGHGPRRAVAQEHLRRGPRRFRTPHRSTMLTGCDHRGRLRLLADSPVGGDGQHRHVDGLCAGVRVGADAAHTRPEVPRPFRCPAIYVVAPLGVLVNLAMMFFLPLDTWFRLVIWLAWVGILLYVRDPPQPLGHALQRQLQVQGLSPTDAPCRTDQQSLQDRRRDHRRQHTP